MTKGRFRVLVAITALFYMWCLTFPRKWEALPPATVELLQRSGADALLTAEHPATPWVHSSYVGILVAAGVGLMLLRRWGRSLLLLHTGLAISLALVTGTSVSLPFETFVGSIASTLSAVVLGAAYSQPISGLLLVGRVRDEWDDDVEALPDEPRGVTLVPVVETGDATELEVVKAWLTAAGIAYVVENDTTQELFAAGRIGGYNFAIGPSRILVAHEDVESARALVADATHRGLN